MFAVSVYNRVPFFFFVKAGLFTGLTKVHVPSIGISTSLSMEKGMIVSRLSGNSSFLSVTDVQPECPWQCPQ
jgi:hypothetical protein